MILFYRLFVKLSPDLKMSINGSYRRKCEDSGDIDVLITGPAEKINNYANS